MTAPICIDCGHAITDGGAYITVWQDGRAHQMHLYHLAHAHWGGPDAVDS